MSWDPGDQKQLSPGSVRDAVSKNKVDTKLIQRGRVGGVGGWGRGEVEVGVDLERVKRGNCG